MNFKSSTLENKIAAAFKFLSIRRGRLWEQHDVKSFMHSTLLSLKENPKLLDQCLQHGDIFKNSVVSMDVYNKESGYNDLFTGWMQVLSCSRFEPLSVLLPQLDQKHLLMVKTELQPMANENRWIVVDIRPHANTTGGVYVVKDGSTFGVKQWVIAPQHIYQQLIEGDIVSINEHSISSIISQQERRGDALLAEG